MWNLIRRWKEVDASRLWDENFHTHVEIAFDVITDVRKSFSVSGYIARNKNKNIMIEKISLVIYKKKKNHNLQTAKKKIKLREWKKRNRQHCHQFVIIDNDCIHFMWHIMIYWYSCWHDKNENKMFHKLDNIQFIFIVQVSHACRILNKRFYDIYAISKSWIMAAFMTVGVWINCRMWCLKKGCDFTDL